MELETEQLSLRLFEDRSPPNSTIFVLGATGCGKTTLIANMLLDRPRFVIIDTRDEYELQFFDGAIAVNNNHDFVKALNVGQNRIIVRVPAGADDESFINSISYHLFAFQKANSHIPVTFAMDELNRFVTPQSSPTGIKELIQRGRGHNIQKIFGAQWFNAIPTYTRDTFSEIIVFRHNEPRGLSMLESYGFDATLVSRLPQHVALIMRHGEIKFLKLTAQKERETVTV